MGKKKLSFKEIMTNYGVIIIMVCLIVFTGITRPNFITTNNLTNILATMSFRLVIALGIAGCIITAGCDLSADVLQVHCSRKWIIPLNSIQT